MELRNRFIKGGRNKQSSEYVDFSRARTQVKKMKSDCYNTHITALGDEIKLNPKRFWGHVSSLQRNNAIPDIMFYNKSEVKGYNSIVKAFCLYFKSQFLFNEVEELPTCMYYDAPLFHLSLIHISEPTRH